MRPFQAAVPPYSLYRTLCLLASSSLPALFQRISVQSCQLITGDTS